LTGAVGDRPGVPPLTAAVVQLSSQDDIAANLARVTHWVAEAARAGAKLVALPENFALIGEEDQKRRAAESLDGPLPGPILSALSKAAEVNGVWLVAGGMPEKSDDPERPYNASVLVAPTGRVVSTYRKIHLFDVDLADGTKLEESRATARGPIEPQSLASVGAVRLGMTVCYDLRFPELYRALTAQGARVVTVPAAFTLTTGKDHWHVLLRARAIEDQLFILAPAQTGKHPRGRQTYGKSLIVDPWGDVLAQCGEGEGFALARLDFDAQDRVRASLPCLTHRRLA
jgi:predicted amidohydrolase